MLIETLGTARDLGRLQEIASVCVRHGLGDAVRRLGLADALARAGHALHLDHAGAGRHARSAEAAAILVPC